MKQMNYWLIHPELNISLSVVSNKILLYSPDTQIEIQTNLQLDETAPAINRLLFYNGALVFMNGNSLYQLDFPSVTLIDTLNSQNDYKYNRIFVLDGILYVYQDQFIYKLQGNKLIQLRLSSLYQNYFNFGTETFLWQATKSIQLIPAISSSQTLQLDNQVNFFSFCACGLAAFHDESCERVLVFNMLTKVGVYVENESLKGIFHQQKIINSLKINVAGLELDENITAELFGQDMVQRLRQYQLNYYAQLRVHEKYRQLEASVMLTFSHALPEEQRLGIERQFLPPQYFALNKKYETINERMQKVEEKIDEIGKDVKSLFKLLSMLVIQGDQ
ncbi:Conserved_hypothetical protein [Hexamita inflata]|uniref:Uncharacterized protein n=1 Tax=Hexamita inflata TaxID=28002 RepID=A0ABP1GLC7_9EUKA